MRDASGNCPSSAFAELCDPAACPVELNLTSPWSQARPLASEMLRSLFKSEYMSFGGRICPVADATQCYEFSGSRLPDSVSDEQSEAL